MEEVIKLKCYFFGEHKNTDEIRRVLDEQDIMYEFGKNSMELLTFDEAGTLVSIPVNGMDTIYIYPISRKIVVKQQNLSDPQTFH